MSSETTIVATQFRLQEWAAQIRECQNRPTGMNVADWCTCNGITKATYYYRLRRVREACLESISEETAAPQVVSVAPTLLQLNKEANICDAPAVGLDIRIKGCSIHVTEETSMRLLAAVLEVIQDAE